jgi:hypothetical protein
MRDGKLPLLRIACHSRQQKVFEPGACVGGGAAGGSNNDRCRRAHLCDSNPTHAVTIMLMEKSVWPGALLAAYMLKVLQKHSAGGGGTYCDCPSATKARLNDTFRVTTCMVRLLASTTESSSMCL